MILSKQLFIFFFILVLGILPKNIHSQESQSPPNFIIIFTDDLGYGDLSSYGHPTIETPHLDKMAQEGMRFSQFYVGANVCSPSRAALLTGRLPIRYGLSGTNKRDVFFPNSALGLPQSETTIAKALKEKNYQTAIIGKWHLGHMPEYLPTSHGFDYYFGIPYSNDMTPKASPKWPPLPLYKNTEIIETGVDQRLLTKRYTAEAIEFIEKNKDQPFFLYYPNHFPHVPLFASDDFEGKSKRGIYGDVISELDWSVGEILEKLVELGIDENTLVIFTSDNGPWLLLKERGGSAGLLYEGKGSAYEGGMRVPAIAWWPETIEPNQFNTALATTMDLYPTILKLAGIDPLQYGTLDGDDILPLLTGVKDNIRDEIYYYNKDKLYAVRKGAWKAHFITKPSYSKEEPTVHDPPLLYNIEVDPSESYNLNENHPEIIMELKKLFEEHIAGITPIPSRMDAIIEE